MRFRDASDIRMTFGKYKGKTLDQIGTTDAGLMYLDWLRGERERDETELDLAIRAYLNEESIAKDLTELIAKHPQKDD